MASIFYFSNYGKIIYKDFAKKTRFLFMGFYFFQGLLVFDNIVLILNTVQEVVMKLIKLHTQKIIFGFQI